MRSIKTLLIITAFFIPAIVAQAAVVPVFDWVDAYVSTGVRGDVVKGVAIDPSDGSVYFGNNLVGSADLDPGAGTFYATSSGSRDVMFVKFDADGAFEWAKTWGGTGSDSTSGVDISADGIYVVTGFSGTVDFDPGAGTSYATSSGSTDTALSKFDSDGTLQWVKTWGGTSADATGYVVISPDGDIYVFGSFTGTTDFDPGEGTSYATSSGSYDGAISKFSSDGTYLWTKTFGGTGFDSISNDLAFTDSGDVLLGGTYSGTVDFDPGAGTSYATSTGGSDAFLLSVTSDGTFNWVKTWGGTGSDTAQSTTVDSNGDIFVAGYFENTADLDPGAGTDSHVSAGVFDASLSKFDSSGTFVWAKTWGDTGYDSGGHVMLDADENLVLVSYFAGTVDFDPSDGTSEKTSAGGSDTYISRFDADGTFIGVHTIGGAGDEYSDDVTIQDARLVITGQYTGANTDFDPSADATDHDSDGQDAFIVSFDLVEPGVMFEETGTRLDEGTDTGVTYTLVLATPPQDDVVVTLTPDAEVSLSTTSITFASTTWDIAQTVTVTAVDDDEGEREHTGVITHTIASDDTDYDGLAVANVTVTINDDGDSDRGSGGRSRSSAPPVVGTDIPDEANDDAVVRLEALITELKAKLAALLSGTPAASTNPIVESVPQGTFPRDLEETMTGPDVTVLQEYLIKQNKGPAAQALAAHGTTQLFGPLTKAALIEFQAAAGISPAAGYFGPKTKAYIGSN